MVLGGTWDGNSSVGSRPQAISKDAHQPMDSTKNFEDHVHIIPTEKSNLMLTLFLLMSTTRSRLSSSHNFVSTRTFQSSLAMTWNETWNDILNGGSPRWKVDDPEVKRQALDFIVRYKPPEETSALRIFCPLAGDDLFIHKAWEHGHDVTAIDLVPEAVAAMRKQFGPSEDDWKSEERISADGKSKSKVWTHSSGRATLYEGDMLEERPELNSSFDAVYDKDSFGALDKTMRQTFCHRISDYLKDEGIVYTEVKNMDDDHPSRHEGPPYHVGKDDLMESSSFGQKFEHVESLGEVYQVPMPGMKQTAHILKRQPRPENQATTQ